MLVHKANLQHVAQCTCVLAFLWNVSSTLGLLCNIQPESCTGRAVRINILQHECFCWVSNEKVKVSPSWSSPDTGWPENVDIRFTLWRLLPDGEILIIT